MCVCMYTCRVYPCDISMHIRRYRNTLSSSLLSFGIILAEDGRRLIFFYSFASFDTSRMRGDRTVFRASRKLLVPHTLLAYVCFTFINVRIYIIYILCHIYIAVCLFYRYFTRRYHGYLYYFFLPFM